MTSSPPVYEADNENFPTLVVSNSRKGPVLVNFWSPRAGPCLLLKQRLQTLAREYGGRFLLVYVNTDAESALARTANVQSIPTTQLYVNGEVIETVRGAESEQHLRAVLDRYVTRSQDPVRVQALSVYQQGDADRALMLLARAAMAEPRDPDLPLDMAKLLMREQRYRQALDLLAALPAEMHRHDEIARLLAHLTFVVAADEAPDEAELVTILETRPGDCDSRFGLAARYLLADRIEPALEQLLAIERINPDYENGRAHKGMLAIFGMLGDTNELVKQFRRHLLDRN